MNREYYVINLERTVATGKVYYILKSGKGFTDKEKDAGRFTLFDALEFCKDFEMGVNTMLPVPKVVINMEAELRRLEMLQQIQAEATSESVELCELLHEYGG